MAEGEGNTDDSQKTEEPTARKLEEARKRGQVIQSREVNNWLMIFAAMLVLMIIGPWVMSELMTALKVFIQSPHAIPMDPRGIQGVMRNLLLTVAGYMAMPLGLLMLTGVLAGFVQVGPLFTAETMKPDLSKLSPVKGFGRLFSMRSVMEFVKGIMKLCIVSIAVVIVLMPYFEGVEHFVGQDVSDALFDMRLMLLRLMLAVLGILFVVAVMDYIYQRHDFMQKMRMSKQEMKDEFKQTEGDPIVKAKLRQLREQKARQRMMQAVPEADVVITNPTHYAVALKYDTAKMDAPVLVAKGVDAVAENIKKIAKENKVPMVENAPLARALFDSMELEQMIPAEHFKAVAEVISYVFRLKGRKL